MGHIRGHTMEQFWCMFGHKKFKFMDFNISTQKFETLQLPTEIWIVLQPDYWHIAEV